MGITAEHKEEIQKSIVEAVIQALENEHLLESDLPAIGQFVLDKIDGIGTHDELVNFVGELASRWPVFKHIESVEKNKAEREEELKTADQIGDLASSGKIEEALGLAKSATEE
jgi:hypothetical protein